MSTGYRFCLRAIQGAPEDDCHVNAEIHSETAIEWVWRCTFTRYSSVLEDSIGCSNGGNLEIQSEIVIDLFWICSWRPCSSQHGGHNRASLEIHLEAVMEQVGWHISRPSLWYIGGCDWASLEMHLEASIERVWRYALAGHYCPNLESVIGQVWRWTWWPWTGKPWGQNHASWDTWTWRPWLCELGGHYQACLEMHFKVMIM